MVPKIALVLSLFLLILTRSSANFPLPIYNKNFQQRMASDTHSYRLPNDTIPLTYDITLEPFFHPDFYFNGQVTMRIEVKANTDRITLHGNKVTIEKVTVKVVNSATDICGGSTENANLHFIYISLSRTVEVSTQLEVYIKYKGKLGESHTGFYSVSYEEHGVTKWLGVTQFQATFARQAFPCYDEPALKAKFIISIVREKKYGSISNMDLKETVPSNDGKYKDVFEETVTMSTYLIAFVVSEFVSIGKGNQKVYGSPNLINDRRGDYGLATGIKMLKALEEFTEIKYHLKKLYHVAIPDNSFSSGAMENWGLVIYREKYIFYKEGLSTASEKQGVAKVIAHEIGHQWFGNLVSPAWWKYLWLNEGFASYFEYYVASLIEPDMRTLDITVTSSLQTAMEFEEMKTARPMSYDVQRPKEILRLFNKISYNKSGSVIRMMEHFLGTDIFRKGLTIYLNNMKFSIATPDNLWEGLQAAVYKVAPNILQGQTVKEIMETWTTNSGYPIIYLKRKNGTIVLSQIKFPKNGDAPVWIVPINYVTSKNPTFEDTSATHWLRNYSETMNIAVKKNEWIILNKQVTGYYRVNYDEKNWKLITDYIKSDKYSKIHVLNRAQLVDDALSLARTGRVSYHITLDLLRYLSREKDYIPLHSFFRGLEFLNKYLSNTDYYDLFKTFVREILQTAYKNLSSEDTGSHTDKLNRINILTWLCRFEDENCLREMYNKIFSLFAFVPISPDLQTPVYCGSVISHTDNQFKWLLLYERYINDNSEGLERRRIVRAFGCARNTTMLHRVLDMAIDKDNTYKLKENSHRTYAFSGVYTSSKMGLDVTFTYIVNNAKEIITKLSRREIYSILNGFSKRLTTVKQKAQMQNFIKSLPDQVQTHYGKLFTTVLDNIQNNIDWSRVYLSDITTWLDRHYAGVLDYSMEPTSATDGSGLVYTTNRLLLVATPLFYLFHH